MTQPDSRLTETESLYLVNKVRVLQTMQAILQQPASNELKQFIESQKEKETDVTMLAFMNLLITDNERNRDIAYTIFKDLEKETKEKQDALLNKAEGQSDATSPIAKAVMEGAGMPPGVSAMLGKALSAPSIEESAKSEAVIEEGEVNPFHIPGELEEISFVLSQGEESETITRTYSIITENTPNSLTQGVNRATGVVMGVKDQLAVQHGFGFVLPLGDDGISIDYADNERCLIKLAMGYPSTSINFDKNEGILLPGVSYFLALHELMSKGYRFLLDLEITPLTSRFALNMRSEIWIDRVNSDNGEKAFISSNDLKALDYVKEKLAFVGFLGGVAQ